MIPLSSSLLISGWPFISLSLWIKTPWNSYCLLLLLLLSVCSFVFRGYFVFFCFHFEKIVFSRHLGINRNPSFLFNVNFKKRLITQLFFSSRCEFQHLQLQLQNISLLTELWQFIAYNLTNMELSRFLRPKKFLFILLLLLLFIFYFKVFAVFNEPL